MPFQGGGGGGSPRDGLEGEHSNNIGTGVGGGSCLVAPQEYRSMTRRSKDIRRSYIVRRNNKKKKDADTSTTMSSTTHSSSARQQRTRPQHLIHERMNQLPASEPIYLDLSSSPSSPTRTTTSSSASPSPPSRSERIRRRLSLSSHNNNNSNNSSTRLKEAPTPSPSPRQKNVTASMEKTWWKGSPFPTTTTNNRKTLSNQTAEQIFYVGVEDGGSVMTGMSQQELLRKKARTESKKRNKRFGNNHYYNNNNSSNSGSSNKKNRKKKAIVNLPPGLLAKQQQEETNAGTKFYSSSSMPSSTASPKVVTMTRQSLAAARAQSGANNHDKSKNSCTGGSSSSSINNNNVNAPLLAACGSSSSSSNNNNNNNKNGNTGLWKLQWGSTVVMDEKESDTTGTAESTLMDSLVIQKTPSMETPYSTVPQTWAVMKEETTGDGFLPEHEQQQQQQQHYGDDNCSIDEYSFPLLSTDALGGIVGHGGERQGHYDFLMDDRGLASIPEIKERSSSVSRSECSSGRVRFAATAELSTIVATRGNDSDQAVIVTSIEMDDTTDNSDLYRSTSYMSYQIDLDSPTSVADILHKSNNHIYTPTHKTRRPKRRSSLSPVRSILRPGKYGDRNGSDSGGFNKAYVRAMSYWKASQILRNRRSSYEEDDIFPSDQVYESKGMHWTPAVTEEEEESLQALRFADPSGAELSPIRENRSASVSEAQSGEEWSEYEDSETMQRLHFIEAVAAVVIQTGYRRYRALQRANALREHRARQQEANAEQGHSLERTNGNISQTPPRIETVLSEDSGVSGSKASGPSHEEPRSPGSLPPHVRAEKSVSLKPDSPPKTSRYTQRDMPRSPKSPAQKPQQKEAVSHHLQSPPKPARYEPPLKMREQALLDQDMWSGEENQSTPERTVKPKQLQADFQKALAEPESTDKTQENFRSNPHPTSAIQSKPRNFVPQPVSPARSLREEHDREGRFPVLADQIPTLARGNVQPPDRVVEAKSSGDIRDGGIPQRVQHVKRGPPEADRPSLSSKASFADSVSFSEITMDKDIHCVEEPKRKSVSQRVQAMEAEEQRKTVPDQVVHMEGQSVRIVTSNVYEGAQQTKNSLGRTRELSVEKAKQVEHADKGRVDWRKGWLSSPQRGQDRSSQEKGKSDASVGSPGKARGLPSPQRKYTRKDGSSISSFAESSVLESGKSHSAKDPSAEAAIKIQSVFRGFWVRDCINVDHYCAMVIQKAFRGYMCRVNYQYDRYRVIVAQSVWRRSIARSDVAHVLACVIILQAAIRGFLGRRERKRCERDLVFVEQKHAAALTIQSSWRRYWCETCLIRTLVDVLISQSVVRGWLARQELKRLKATTQPAKESSSHNPVSKQIATTVEEEIQPGEKAVTTYDTVDGNSVTCAIEVVKEESFDSSASMQKETPESSPGRSTASTESSIPATPPKVLQRVTQKRSALEPPWSPSSGANSEVNSADTKPGARTMLVLPVDEDDESEPGLIPAVKRVSRDSGVPRDGRPPIAPIRVKSSKLAEKYEIGLRKAEKERQDAQKKPAARNKVQNIPPVDVEDTGSAQTSVDSEGTVDDASRETSADVTTSTKDETDTIEETKTADMSEAKKGNKQKRTEEMKQTLDDLPEEHPYKGYYKTWADRGMFRPKTPPVSSIIAPDEEEAITVSKDKVGARNSDEIPVDPIDKSLSAQTMFDEKRRDSDDTESRSQDESGAAEEKKSNPCPPGEGKGTAASPEVTPIGGNDGSTVSNSGDGRASPSAGERISLVPESVKLENQATMCFTNSDDTSITGPKLQLQHGDNHATSDSRDETGVTISPVPECGDESKTSQGSVNERIAQLQKRDENRVGIHSTGKPRVSHVSTNDQNAVETTPPDPMPSVAYSTKSDPEPTPSVSSSGIKSIVVYPEGFEPKRSRRKIVDRPSRSASSEEKKDTDSLVDSNRNDSGECQSIEPQNVIEEEAKTMRSTPEKTALEKTELSTLEQNAQVEQVLDAEDPFFSAYMLWHKKGLLSWKPVSSL